jgi:nucleotide-binding universal stress UspA family protein
MRAARVFTGRDLYGPIVAPGEGSLSLPADLAALPGDLRAIIVGPRARVDEGWHWKELVAFIAEAGEAEASLLTAADCALTLGMRLRVLHILDPVVADDLRLRHPRLYFRDDSYVRNLVSDLTLLATDDALEVEGEILYGAQPVNAITDYLERHPDAMPFVGMHRRAEALLDANSLAARVVERSPNPALVVALAER